ncbi:glycoside hydrolase family 13 protein [Flavobacterium gawalongense]|uniref:Alpha-glucosidase n=1 Tax=Flavobacterium gawalongense TaxID=2594432 RepID=A0ABY3CRL1_9FLAO|nr:alpha-glucosidase [Flavobacterium gawalongense]TRX01320.1 alpha-glucosidase [Flavobacterium gawalongense]TRX05844.1 alpha-glucosidase [Flavobacterium gawalongense]
MNKTEKTWWKEAVVYQIYPRSFKDSNGDGIGDLQGIISKLDYIKSLGIDVVWLNPVYSSPNDDNGYDISDYQNIMSEFGTMEDFDELLKGMHERGIKLVMDLVVNHSSDEHFWFKESRKSRKNPYRDYYHWVNAEDGKPAPRRSFFDPEGDAWKYDEATNAYYLHYFSQKQPDLKWENPKLRHEIYDMMHYWFKKGIDGFRMDVITFISKDLSYPPIPEKYQGKMWDYFYASGERLHEYLHEMNREVLSKYDIMSVAEGPGTSTENVLDFVDADRNELNMSYHFDHAYLGLLPRKVVAEEGWKLVDLKAIFTRWDKALAEKGWGAIYFGNHDQPRMVSRWGNDSPEWRALSSKMLTTFLLSMRGTPYYYQGDEIGMSNIKFDTIEDYRDIETINWYNLTKKEGGDLERFLSSHKITARDNGRTPIQWDNSSNGGFTNTTPWIKVNPNYETVNVANQENDPDSVLNYFRKITKLRKLNPVLIYGKYTLLDQDNPDTYCYTRELDDTKVVVMLNFKPKKALVDLGINISKTEILISNYNETITQKSNGEIVLNPFHAVILELN